MKKTKKLVLAKETVRSLGQIPKGVEGGKPPITDETCNNSFCDCYSMPEC